MVEKREELVALAACPFCNSPHVSQWSVGSTVQCNTCGASGPSREVWNGANRRAQASAVPPEREAKLREALAVGLMGSRTGPEGHWIDIRFETLKDMQDARSAIIAFRACIAMAALSSRDDAAEQGVAVKVKPLEWGAPSAPDASCPYDHVTAESSVGKYLIEWKSWKFDPSYIICLDGEYITGDDSSLESAKAAAQADYETRIKSALDIEAQGVAVSVEEFDLTRAVYDSAPSFSWDECAVIARALLDKYSIRSAMMTEGRE